MKIWAHFYTLCSDHFLNSQSLQKMRAGALLKIEFSHKKFGYCDFHENTVMNQQGSLLEKIKFLREKLKFLKNFRMNLQEKKKKQEGVSCDWLQEVQNQQLKNSLDFARQDFFSRLTGQYLISEIPTIKNHRLIVDIENFDSLKEFEKQGFDLFKLKIGRNLDRETECLKNILYSSSKDTRFRLDFNSSLNYETVKNWLKENISFLIPKIEFIEDPFNYNYKEWKSLEDEYSIPLALDFVADPLELTAPYAFSVLVLKPAFENLDSIIQKYRESRDINFVFTHFMDHELGQIGSLYWASVYKKKMGDRVLDCGLHPGSHYSSSSLIESKFSGPVFKEKNLTNSSFFEEEFQKKEWVHVL